MGFGAKWRQWILSCLKSASISILVNGSPTKEFSLGRGIRQGDPLSQFLFILAAEGLNILTKVATEKELLKGVKISNDKVNVSHLQYADDTIFIGEWSQENSYSLQNLLKCFELASGLKVNFHKSCLYGLGVGDEELNIYGRCGGLDLEIEAIWSLKPSLWRNILLTGVDIQDLNIGFRTSFVKEINDGSSTSFWNDNWIGGNKLCIQFPRLYRLEKFKYVLVRNQIVQANDAAQFKDASVNRNSNDAAVHVVVSVNVHNVLVFDAVQNGAYVRAFNHTTDREGAAQNLNAAVIHIRDNYSWSLCANGKFIVKVLSSIIQEQLYSGNSSPLATLRNNLIPRKIEIFVRRCLQKRLPVMIELDKRGIDLHSVRCPICDDDIESVEHSLIFCKDTMAIWDRMFSWWGLGNMSNFSLNENLCSNGPSSTTTLGKKIWQAVEWVSAYLIWANRNNMVFKGKKMEYSIGVK
ncbi:uncharacterized protein [Rutidosis leptorrhynchoides]|uniref:uncharacterized protein n=1 Tax=Rutidosis leptorrhynchoides TaxID=125765 RepID=UPI003A9990A3